MTTISRCRSHDWRRVRDLVQLPIIVFLMVFLAPIYLFELVCLLPSVLVLILFIVTTVSDFTIDARHSRWR